MRYAINALQFTSPLPLLASWPLNSHASFVWPGQCSISRGLSALLMYCYISVVFSVHMYLVCHLPWHVSLHLSGARIVSGTLPHPSQSSYSHRLMCIAPGKIFCFFSSHCNLILHDPPTHTDLCVLLQTHLVIKKHYSCQMPSTLHEQFTAVLPFHSNQDA
jgi:hypothetical protein